MDKFDKLDDKVDTLTREVYEMKADINARLDICNKQLDIYNSQLEVHIKSSEANSNRLLILENLLARMVGFGIISAKIIGAFAGLAAIVGVLAVLIKG